MEACHAALNYYRGLSGAGEFRVLDLRIGE